MYSTKQRGFIMKNTIRSLIVLLSVFFVAAGLYAASDTATQSVTMTVSEIAVLDVTANPGTLTIAAPGTGGETPADPSDNSTYAQYTSTVGAGQSRAITAEIGGGDSTPAGTTLTLGAAPSGNTNEGSTAGTVTLSSTAQNVVTGVGSCATGTGATDGAQLTYTLVIGTMTDLVAGASETATVTLTLTDPS